MAEDKRTDTLRTHDTSHTIEERTSSWFRDNLENIVLVIVCLAFIFRGFASIERTGKTALEIVADGTIAFMGGYIIKSLMNKRGIIKGMISPKFISTTNMYGEKKVEISPFVEELDAFCYMKNADRLKQKQKEFLLKYAMSYNKYINGDYSDDHEAIKKCRDINVFQYTSVMLTNAYDNVSNEEELLTATIKKYEVKQRAGDLGIGLITFLLFGYYSLKPNGLDMSSVLWCSLQVAIFLANGMMKYMNAFFFVTETLRGKIKRVIDILDEFINTRNKHVGIFTDNSAPIPAPAPIKTPNIILEPN